MCARACRLWGFTTNSAERTSVPVCTSLGGKHACARSMQVNTVLGCSRLCIRVLRRRTHKQGLLTGQGSEGSGIVSDMPDNGAVSFDRDFACSSHVAVCIQFGICRVCSMMQVCVRVLQWVCQCVRLRACTWGTRLPMSHWKVCVCVYASALIYSMRHPAPYVSL